LTLYSLKALQINLTDLIDWLIDCTILTIFPLISHM